MDASKAGHGAATASQTAWALMALLAADRASDRASIERGLLYLIEHQDGGTWIETAYTGTGFPGYGVGQSIRCHDAFNQATGQFKPFFGRQFKREFGDIC